jgi:hypothetical protein
MRFLLEPRDVLKDARCRPAAARQKRAQRTDCAN